MVGGLSAMRISSWLESTYKLYCTVIPLVQYFSAVAMGIDFIFNFSMFSLVVFCSLKTVRGRVSML